MSKTAVKTGIDSIVTQNGRVVGYATSVEIDENLMQQAIKVLGKHGPIGFKSLDYECDFTVGTFVLDPVVDGQPVQDNLIVATRENVNTIEPFTFELIDNVTNKVFLKLIDAVNDGNSLSLTAGQLATKNSRWKATRLQMVYAK